MPVNEWDAEPEQNKVLIDLEESFCLQEPDTDSYIATKGVFPIVEGGNVVQLEISYETMGSEHLLESIEKLTFLKELFIEYVGLEDGAIEDAYMEEILYLACHTNCEREAKELYDSQIWHSDRKYPYCRLEELRCGEQEVCPDGEWWKIRFSYIKRHTARKLKHLPKNIGNLTSLESPKLHRNSLSSLPDSIGELELLEELDLKENDIISLPKSIGQLKALRTIDLSGNHLRTLPDSFGELETLINIDFSNNQLTSIPKLGEMKELRFLVLKNNKLTTSSFQKTSSLEGLTSFRTLDLSGNQLTPIPL